MSYTDGIINFVIGKMQIIILTDKADENDVVVFYMVTQKIDS